MQPTDINRVVISGNLAREPKMHVLPRGESVCNLMVVTHSRARNPRGGDEVDKLNYFDVKVYGMAAQLEAERSHRGRPVIVEGKLDWREWETNEGHQACAVSILAETLEFLDGREHQDAVITQIDWDQLLSANLA